MRHFLLLTMLLRVTCQRRLSIRNLVESRMVPDTSRSLAGLLLASAPSHTVQLAAKCGNLQCQREPYQQHMVTRVLACSPSREKKEKGKIWEVKLQDTVIFPEGGGQPWDLGQIGEASVTRALNIDGEAVHFVDADIPVGSEVEVIVDWARREDHMQQHTAQHLITALAEDMFGFKTLAWNLKTDDVAITLDLDTEEMTPEQLNQLEQRCNQAIAEEHAVTPRWIAHDSDKAADIRCRGLPDGVTGSLRVLEIEGIDANLCCGTHVKNLAHLRQIKLLNVERMRSKGRTFSRLNFAAGGRLLRLFEASFKRQMQLNALLNAKPESHVEMVETLANTKKLKWKEAKDLLAEVKDFTVDSLKERAKHGEKVLDVHREIGDNDFMRDLASAMEDSGVLLLTTIGAESGTFMLSGPPELVAELGPQVAKLLDGRGGGKASYQGKAQKLSGRGEALKFLRQAVEVA